jgi:hypothetical protein
MNQIKIHIIQSQLLQAYINCASDVLDICDNLCGNEELLTGDPAVFDGFSELDFGVIDFGAIEVVISKFDSRFYGFDEGVVEAVVRFFVPGCACSIAKL